MMYRIYVSSIVVIGVALLSMILASKYPTKGESESFYILDFEEIPSHLRLSNKNMNHCRWSAYNSELILYKTLLRHPLRIKDPQKASFFIAPFFGACYLFNCWTQHEWQQNERCGVSENYAGPMMKWINTFWKISKPVILFQPMDHIDSYYDNAKEMRSKAIYLVSNADFLPGNESRSLWRPGVDVVIPSATHLLNSYHVHPRDYLDYEGYPYKAGALNTTVEAPYLSIQRTSLESRRYGVNSVTLWELFWDKFQSFIKHVPEVSKHRKYIGVFRGSFKPDDGKTKYSYGLNLRPKIKRLSNNPLFSVQEISSTHEYALALANAKYGLAPPGYTMDTTRIWEYLAFGVVPVFLGTGPKGGQAMPFASHFDWDDFSIYIAPNDVDNIEILLANIPEKLYSRLHHNAWSLGRTLVLDDVQMFPATYILAELFGRIKV